MLGRVVDRVRAARSVAQVVVATSVDASDDSVADFCTEGPIACFRGNSTDVLDRYYQASRQFAASNIVRITGDCPLTDPELVDKVVAAFAEGAYDYVSNLSPRSYPDGLDVEVFSFAALERAWHEARALYDREHVTPYLRGHPELFRMGNVEHSEDISRMRWTVDYPQDMEFVRAVYDHMKRAQFGFAEVLELLRKHPELKRINNGVESTSSIG